jgi:hypothetical protein
MPKQKTPKDGFVCIGEERGWCGRIHRTEPTAERCVAIDDGNCHRQLKTDTDRQVYATDDKAIESQEDDGKFTFFLKGGKAKKPSKAKAAKGKKGKKGRAKKEPEPEPEPEPELDTDEEKVLKVIFDGFSVTAEDISSEMDWKGTKKAASVSKKLVKAGVVETKKKNKVLHYSTVKTHDDADWDEVLSDYQDA